MYNIIDIGYSSVSDITSDIIYLILNIGQRIDVAYNRHLKNLLFLVHDDSKYIAIVKI